MVSGNKHRKQWTRVVRHILRYYHIPRCYVAGKSFDRVITREAKRRAERLNWEVW